MKIEDGGKNSSFSQNFKNSYLWNDLSLNIKQSISKRLILNSIQIADERLKTLENLLPYLVKAYDVIKWQNVQNIFLNTLALPYTACKKHVCWWLGVNKGISLDFKFCCCGNSNENN